MKPEVVEAWTSTDLMVELERKGHFPGRATFYRWLQWALIRDSSGKHIDLYSNRDRAKLLKFAELRRRYPGYSNKSIQRMLANDLITNAENYPNDTQ